jgi:hypothetical protein
MRQSFRSVLRNLNLTADQVWGGLTVSGRKRWRPPSRQRVGTPSSMELTRPMSTAVFAVSVGSTGASGWPRTAAKRASPVVRAHAPHVGAHGTVTFY